MKNTHVFGVLGLGIQMLATGGAPAVAQTAFVSTAVSSSSPSNGGAELFVRSFSGPPPQVAEFDADLFPTPYSKAAAASSENLAVRARASLAGNPGALAGVPRFDIQNFQGFPADADIDRIEPLAEATRGNAVYRDVVTSSAQATALLNVYFDRTLALAIGDPSLNQAFLDLYMGFDDVTPDPQPGLPPAGEIEISRIEAGALATLQLTSGDEILGDGSLFRQTAGLGVFSFASLREFAEYSRTDGLVTYLGSRFETESYDQVFSFEVRNGVTIFQNDVTTPVPFEGSRQAAGNFALPFEFIDSLDYGFDLAVFCDVRTTGAASFAAGTLANCDASRSGYWNGLTNVRGPDGNRLPTFSLTGASGFDFRNASPFSPAPATDVTGVPEPGQWALLISGFAMVAATLRRRRRPAAIAA